MTTLEIRNPQYNHIGTIDCEINHPVYGWIPFTAQPNDVELAGREIYTQVMLENAGEIAPYIAPTVNEDALLTEWRNTTEVTRFQARAALYQAGYMDAINAYMNAEADPIAKMAWEDAQVFRRMSPTVLALQTKLDLSDAQLDDLFKFAMTIEA